MKQILSLATLCAVLCLPTIGLAQSSDGDTNPVMKTPVLPCVAIPGATTGAGVHLPFPLGFAFSNAWTCWIVTAAADSDVTEVGRML